jgi:Zn-dependent metalloprotease
VSGGGHSGAASDGQALGLGAGERLVVKDVITDRNGSSHVRYDRTFGGLRVIGGDLVSHRARSGKIMGVSWNGSQRVAVASTKPTLSLATASAAGIRKASRVQQKTVASKGELVVYSGGAFPKATPRLAYDVLTTGVRADQTPSRLHTIVDANTGATLTSWDEIENGTGNGINVGAVGIGTTAGPPWLMRDAVGNYTTDLSGLEDDMGTAPGTTFTDADDSWGNGTVSDRASAGVDAHFGAGKTFDYFKNIQGRNGIWNTGVGARSRVHYGNGYANAFWDGTQMTYGDGAGNTHPLTELDIAGHEMTHGVTQNTANLLYAGESGGLSEATSDIFGTAVEFYADNASDTPDYLIGELADLHGNGTPLRYLDRPSRDGVSRDCWSPTLGALDVHYSSGPLNHWFFLASEGSGGKTINGVSYNSPTCNASTVTGIGHDKAARIWYRSLTTYLTSSSTYAAAREGAIQSARDLYGATSAECTSVEASFSAIDVPAGVATCGITPPPPSGSNLLSNPGFESGNTLWAATSAVIGQNGAWGQPPRSGTWNAWMGGYGTAHTDSISQLVTLPAGSSATLSYYLHIDTTEEPGIAAYDTMTVRAGAATLQAVSNLDAANGYQLRTVSLSAFSGQTISLSFSAAEDGWAQTSFVVDDTSVTTSTSSGVPGAPTAVSATAGDGQAVVSWTPPAGNGGSPVTKYTVTSAPGGRTATTTGATTATVTGLTNGTAYTFTVIAANLTGTSAASAPSAAVIPRTVPGAPTAVSADAGNAQALVSWTVPVSNGGSPVTKYTVTSAPGGRTATTTGATTATVTGLTNGTAYTFTVTAANLAGTSPASVASAAVTPSSSTVPGAPTAVSATAGNGQAGVSWLAPASNGGSTLTGYLVRVVDAATSAQVGALRPAADGATNLTVTGLANGTGYRFQVQAANAVGAGAYSALSAAVTPSAAAAVTRLSDFNRDGFTDLVARDGAGILWLYPGDGAGGIQTRRQLGTGWNLMTAIVTPGDVDGDGNADVLARDGAGVLWLYPGNGASGLGAPRQIGSSWNTMSWITAAGDFSGDGHADVLARDVAGVLWLFPMTGDAVIQPRRLVSSGWGEMTFIMGPGDVSGDGRADMLGRDSGGMLRLYRGNGTGGVGGRAEVSSRWQAMTALLTPGNWDGAGGNDVLARDSGGALWLYPGNNAGDFGQQRAVSGGWSR